MKNQYYILPNTDKNIFHECKDVVGNFEDARQNLAKTKFVTKTANGVYNSECLKPHKPYSHQEILEYLNNPANGFVEPEI